MGAGGDQAKSSGLEARGEGINVIDPELDFDFAVGSHAASIKKGAGIGAGRACVPKKLFGMEKVTFFIIRTKKNFIY